ncbi:cofactor assembly of complex C subunit B [Thermosynechococcus sp. PKX82]|uniref:cofactor assembly of complex C subunit B n=1 Tax=Thermosynechococcus sp. PKX82 TaxID=3074086 RepID=UPI002873716C|nr:cofactor assembly of complex C subunit B [Thermosynechococcus sp. PKX82]WNC28916.1 cofactor assembly of complex C subunit B [Thermosynechococcus sp. PKX82]
MNDQVLRYLPLTTGVLGGTLLLINRLLTPLLTPSQARADVVGVILAAVLILTTLIWQRVQPRPAEAVILEGEEGFELADDLDAALKTELAWLSYTLLKNTPTKSIVIWRADRPLLRRGILGPKPMTATGAIVQRALQTQRPIYLVNLALYPGRIEFDYLPPNTQGVICQPVDAQTVMILGTNAPRRYTKQDEQWVAALAAKLAQLLAEQYNKA